MNHAQAKIRNDKIRILYEHGEHPTDIANAHFVDPTYIRTLAKKFGWTIPTFVKKSSTRLCGRVGMRAISDRDIEWKEKYQSGMTLEQISAEYGLSRERIRQVLKLYFGLSKDDGGCAIRLFKKTPDRVAAKIAKEQAAEQKHFKKFGCSKEFIAGISALSRSSPQHPIRRYVEQRRNAEVRSIGWDITFFDWWNIWQESGKWEQRGRGKGYCMARLGDDGPYKIGNVEIITIGQNFSDSYIKTPWAKRFPNAKRINANVVSFYPCLSHKYKSWQVAFRGKYIARIPIK